MELSLEGKVALVTGASRGIGLAVASRFAEAGAAVMLASRKADALAEGVAEIGGRTGGAVAYHVADVAKRDDAEACAAATVERFGAIDILVNNAGTNPTHGPLIDVDEEMALRVVHVNQLAVIRWVGAACRAGMGNRGGAVVNVTAIGGIDTYRNAGWYGATKAAVNHMTKQLAFELAPSVRVNTVAPGVIDTDFAVEMVKEYGDALANMAATLPMRDNVKLAARVPMQRLGTGDDIAYAALFLASDAASWITGQVLSVDGGALTVPRS